MERGYKVLKLNELAKELNLPSSKGIKTKEYLELVINTIEERGLRFVQFLQLVDVLYVIIQKVEIPIRHVSQPAEKFRPEEEIERHYNYKENKSGYEDEVLNQRVRESHEENKAQKRDDIIEAPPELEEVKKRDHLQKEMNKVQKLPWQK